jgi:hypothetical protein
MREMVYLRLSINAGQVSKDEKRTEKGIHHLSPLSHAKGCQLLRENRTLLCHL